MKKIIQTGVLAVIVSMSLLQTAAGENITIANSSFEDNMLVDTDFTTFIDGWTNTGDSGSFNPGTGQYTTEAPDGENVAFSAVGGPEIAQILTETLQPLTQYELSILVGNRLDINFGGYQVRLMADGVELVGETNVITPTDGTFEKVTLSYTSTATDAQLGQPLEIRFRSFGAQTNFDDVQLRTVPEPTALALLVSIPALCVLRRRRIA